MEMEEHSMAEEIEPIIDTDPGEISMETMATGSDHRDHSPENAYRRSIYSIPVDVHVTIGTARPTISELLQMKRDSLIQLSSKIDDPVELYVGNKVIARGELVEADGGAGTIGVRLTEIVDMSEDTLT